MCRDGGSVNESTEREHGFIANQLHSESSQLVASQKVVLLDRVQIGMRQKSITHQPDRIIKLIMLDDERICTRKHHV